MSDFDTIAAMLEDDLCPYRPATMPKIKGDTGQRLLEWTVEGIDTEYVDFSMISDELSTERGVVVQETAIFEDIEAEEEGSMSHLEQIMVGNLDLDDDKCWALFVECDVMFDANFESNANFKLMEGRRQIEAFIALHQDGVIKEIAENILNLVNFATKGQPDLLLRLRELMQQQGGEAVFKVWDSEANGNALEAQTPTARGQSKRPRV